MSIIYLESTVNLLISSGEKEKVQELIKSGQVKRRQRRKQQRKNK